MYSIVKEQNLKLHSLQCVFHFILLFRKWEREINNKAIKRGDMKESNPKDFDKSRNLFITTVFFPL